MVLGDSSSRNENGDSSGDSPPPRRRLPGLSGAQDGWAPPLEYCSVSVGARLIADRWTMLIVREILVGNVHFNAIHRGLSAMSRSLLVSRLRYLERIGVVERGADPRNGRAEYRLSRSGLALRPVLEALGAWALDWELPPNADSEVSVTTLMWQMRLGIDRSALPSHELTLAFRFPGVMPSSAWIRVEGQDVRACIGVPDQEPDLTVIVEPSILNELWWGKRACATAIARGEVGFEGPVDLARAYPGWFRPAPISA